jgi:hypothetical protein
MAFYYGTNCPGLNVEALQNRRKNGSKEYSCKGVNSMVSILLEFIVHCFASSIHVIISFQTIFKAGSKATESKLHEKTYVERERERERERESKLW